MVNRISTPGARRRWLLGVLFAVALVCAAAYLIGCSASGWTVRNPFGSGTPGTGGGSSSNGVPSLWGGVAGSLASLDWWMGVAGGVCILVGVARLLGRDLAGGGKAIGCGIALFAVNAVVAAVLPGLVWIAIVCTAVLGGVWAYRLATGRGTGLGSVGRTVGGWVSRILGRKAQEVVDG